MEKCILPTAKKELSLWLLLLVSCVMLFSCSKGANNTPDKPAVKKLSQRFVPGIYQVTLHEIYTNNAWQLEELTADACENNQFFSFSTYPTDYVQMTNKCVVAAQSPQWPWLIDDASGTLTVTDSNNNTVMAGPFTVEDDNHYIVFTNINAANGIPERYTMNRPYN